MYLFLIPLILGFAINILSAFTTALARTFGPRWGMVATAFLRNFLGIPLWAIGLILAYGEASPMLFPSNIVNQVVGWIFMIGGIALILVAMFSIQWRAAATVVSDKIVEKGIYSVIRHPVYAGVALEVTGLLLIKPSQAFGVATLVALLWVILQAKAEEYDLLQRMPAYREYMKRVPGFIPVIRKRETS